MAICETCGGKGRVWLKEPQPLTLPNGIRGTVDWIVCPNNCMGGVISCCEGTERDAGVAGVDAPPKGQKQTLEEYRKDQDLIVEDDLRKRRQS